MAEMETMLRSTQPLNIALWALYCLGILFIACRTSARRIDLGSFKKFHIDDYIMLLITVTFTGVFVTAYEVSRNGSNYTVLGFSVEELTASENKRAIYGSQMTFVLEEFLIVTTWLVKACILLLYSRLTLGFWQYTFVKILSVYCCLGFVVIQILLFGVWCRPFSQYWAISPANSQCATYYSHMIVTAVFNISSDLCMLAIPLPLLMTSYMPKRRKLILCTVFSLGVFVVLAAILNKYYNFTQKFSLIFLNWYVGEVTTAVIVANIPLCFPLVRRVFKLDAWGSSSGSRNLDWSLADMGSTVPRRLIIGATTIMSTTITASHERGRTPQTTQGVQGIDDLEISTLPYSPPVEELERRVEVELGLLKRMSDKSISQAVDDLERGIGQQPASKRPSPPSPSKPSGGIWNYRLGLERLGVLRVLLDWSGREVD